jgi:hypothetical protein
MGWLPPPYKGIIKGLPIMATPKTKKILDRQLAKALRDLNQFFTAKEISKKFKIKPWQVYSYKKYRKRKPLPKAKRDKIIEFWEYLKKASKREDLLYQYRVVKGRLKPSPSVSFEITKKTIDKVGIEKLAKRLKVRPETVKRWAERGTLYSKKEIKKKLFKEFQKYYRRWVGLFFICEYFRERGKKEPKGYCRIVYARHFNGSKEDLIDYVIANKTFGEVNRNQLKKDSLIADIGKFKEKQVENFFRKYLPRVSPTKLTSSLNECYDFLKENFKGEALDRLTAILKEYEK